MDEPPSGATRPRRGLLWAAAAGIAVVGGVVGGVIVWALQPSTSSQSAACEATTVADRTLPTIVTIGAQGSGGSGTGSGEMIRSEGYVLTNNHVISIAVGGGSVSVQFDDGSTVPATIVGRDPATDLAVLKVATEGTHVTIPLGSSDDVAVGQPVVALGAPLGLSSTVTAGIVSAVDRTIQVPGDNGQAALLVAAVQTDASINPGNSGGALVDCRGRLIGVNSAGASVPNPSGGASAGSVGLNFAIPVDLAKTVASEIIDTGSVTHAFIGMEATPLPGFGAADKGVDHGLLVTAVSANGPAAGAGLTPGDVLTQINGQRAATTLQLAALELGKRAGDKVALTYVRNGKTGTTTLTLAGQA